MLTVETRIQGIALHKETNEVVVSFITDYKDNGEVITSKLVHETYTQVQKIELLSAIPNGSEVVFLMGW